ncbi:MAG TPA: relaxase/mobilization nuclease domain-containing protein [Bacteroidia bacterium]|nr:relaxase/mobilization nuclease domain-containing protein [Bacteroidia bacterium]
MKIKTHKSAGFKKLLNYMLFDKDRLFDDKGKSFVVSHNLNGKSIDSWVRQFTLNESFRKIKRIDSTILTHEILSWHAKDASEITLDKLKAMTHEYIRLRNFNGMFLAIPHFDKEHYHVHICASGLEFRTGKSLRLSRNEFTKLKKDIQLFQQQHFPELSHSVVEHGKLKPERMTDKEFQYKLRSGRDSKREMLSAILKTCYKKAISRETFFELLKDCNAVPYTRGGVVKGVTFEGLKFRFERGGFGERWLEWLEKSNQRESKITDIRGKKSDLRKEIKSEGISI